jgi:hypothetical protein
MIGRCTNPNNSHFASYGGRGISVCDRWRDFPTFLADMGEKPVGMSIDRIDIDGNYEPGNCRWTTAKQQARNKRSTRLLTYDGQTRPLLEWAERLGLNPGTLSDRVYAGWSDEAALTTPVAH